MSGKDGRPPSDDRRDSASRREGWTSERDEQNPERSVSRRENSSSGLDEVYGRSDDDIGDRIARVARSDSEWIAFAREVLSSVVAVLLVGLLLFAVSGVWPPMVAVESESMVPHMEKGDLVFVMEEHRLAPENAHGDTGVVTAATGDRVGYSKFDQTGDVIVYRPDGSTHETPIIHRAMLWVDKGENWYDRANPRYVGGASNCQELANCPADHAGFITKGDNNAGYDQALGISTIVSPEWVIGTAELRIPYLGWIRLSLATLNAGPQSLVIDVGVEPAAMTGTAAPTAAEARVAGATGA